MGILAWLILLAVSAALATVGQFAFFRKDGGLKNLDWTYIAGGALLGGFTASVWYPGFGPVVDGLNLAPAVAGSMVGGVVVELVYRFAIRRRGVA